LLLFVKVAGAQQTSVFTDPNVDYRQALQLFQQEKYNASQEKFREAIARMESGAPAASHEQLMNAQYYDACCSKELHRPDAEKLFTDLIENNEENAITRRARYQRGNMYFEQKKYNKALPDYKRVDPADLSEDETSQFTFQFATCYFYQKDFAKAKPLFEKIKDQQNDYYYPSNYYYGYIAYKQNDFQNALKSFRIAEKSELYKPVIPYYLANIDFMQHDYDAVINDAALLTAPSSPYSIEMQQLVGKAYFEKQQYEKALPFFTAYLSGTQKISKTDLYQIGFCQYKAKQYDDAIKSFEQLNVLNDSLGENALYLLGDCYVKTSRKNDARLAFESASKMNFDSFVKEQSSFQYAKLSHELNYHDVSITALQKFVSDYPKSSYVEEAKQYLTQEFLSTSNYRDALEVMKTLSVKSPEMRRAYQKIAYARATELYNDKNYPDAIDVMEESLKNPVDPSLTAAAHFWEGEASFNLKQFDEAINEHNQFLDLVTSSMKLPQDVSVAHAHYTLGYSYLKQQDYDKANSHFQSAKTSLASSADDLNKKIYSDAVLRSGDCEFMLHSYADAIANYDLIITIKSTGTDYALYQKAIILGLQNHLTDKISNLKTITATYPASIYADDAWYELGISYLTIPSYQDAAQAFNTVISKYPSSSYVVKSHLKLGLIYFNLDQNDQALEQYQWVLNKYPKSGEGDEALSGVKEVFTDKGDAQGYLNFVKGLPDVNVSDAAKDSVLYLSAENKYSKGDCASTVGEFTNYLSTFPSGAFVIPAHFYRGECLSRQNDFDHALNDYEYVADQPQNRFSEKALLQAARINYSQKKDFDKSFHYYQLLSTNADFKSDALEAAKGMMYSAYNLNRYDDAASAAKMILASGNAGSDDETEAHFYLGKIALAANKDDDAFNEFTMVSKTTSTEMGAESAFHIAEIYFRKNELKQTEDQCWYVIKQKPTHDYWIAKSYLLIADVYFAQNDFFQSKATLQSIIDNYKGDDDIIPSARQKLDEVKAREANQSKLLPDSTGTSEQIEPDQNSQGK